MENSEISMRFCTMELLHGTFTGDSEPMPCFLPIPVTVRRQTLLVLVLPLLNLLQQQALALLLSSSLASTIEAPRSLTEPYLPKP